MISTSKFEIRSIELYDMAFNKFFKGLYEL